MYGCKYLLNISPALQIHAITESVMISTTTIVCEVNSSDKFLQSIQKQLAFLGPSNTCQTSQVKGKSLLPTWSHRGIIQKTICWISHYQMNVLYWFLLFTRQTYCASTQAHLHTGWHKFCHNNSVVSHRIFAGCIF